ncbi:MAG: hypothetical protein JWQ11_529 [Rhizobacter sp.]|nr:hypothetical protein [Rhizobacter sp.]
MATGNHIFLSLLLASGSKVEGEATALGFEGQVEVSEFGWGVGQAPILASKDMEMPLLEEARVPGTADASAPVPAARRLLASQALNRAPPPGGSAGQVAGLTRVPLRDVTFKKRFDISSTVLMKALNSLEVLTEARFTVLRQGEIDGSGKGSAHAGMFIVTLQSVHVKEMKVGLSAAGIAATVVEEVTLGYKDIEIGYRPAQQRDVMTFSHRTTAKKWAPR